MAHYICLEIIISPVRTGWQVDSVQWRRDANNESMPEHNPTRQDHSQSVQTRVAAWRVTRADDPRNIPVEGEGAHCPPGGARCWKVKSEKCC